MVGRTSLAAIARSLALLGLAAPAAHAQDIKRYDMGPAGSPVATHFASVKLTTNYNSTAGAGWAATLPSGSVAVQRTAPGSDLPHNLPGNLILDAITIPSGQSGVFRVDLAVGTYYVIAYLGDLGETSNATPIVGMDVAVNDDGVNDAYEAVVNDAFARIQGGAKATLTGAKGGYKRVSFLADVETGHDHLHVKFSGGNPKTSVMGLEIYPYTEPPVRFDHATLEFVVTAPHAELEAALDELNDHDYAGAEAALAEIPTTDDEDKLARAWGTSCLIGCLTNAMEQVDFVLVADTIALLEQLGSNSSAVKGLLQDLKDFEMGAKFVWSRGYTPPGPYPGYNPDGWLGGNLKRGTQLLEQIQDDVLLPTAEDHRPESPLHAKAQYLCARAMYGRNSRVATTNPLTPDAGIDAFNDYWCGILDSLWFRLDPMSSACLYPRAHEATLLAWLIREYAKNEGQTPLWGRLRPWDDHALPEVPSGWFEEGWWWPDVTFGGTGVAPSWAEYQRDYGRMYRTLGQWWMNNRLHEGEIGGGGGDDTEGAGALGAPLLTFAETAPRQPEAGIREALDHVLRGPDVNQAEGYRSVPIDPEHGGEYTSYPLFILLPTFFGNPYYLEFALRTMRNMNPNDSGECATDEPWTDYPTWAPSGRLHMQAYMVGACEVDTPAYDIVESMKSLTPGFAVLNYSSPPGLETIWNEYGLAWADAAMRTNPDFSTASDTKPKGIFPAAVSFASGDFGDGTSWWKLPCVQECEICETGSGTCFGSSGIAQNALELYELLLNAYRRTNDDDYLRPIFHAIDFIHHSDIGTGPCDGLTEGQDAWVACQMREIVATAAFRARQEILAEWPTFGSEFDHLHTFGVTPTSMVNGVIHEYGPMVVRFLNDSTPGGATDKDDMAELYEDEAKWLRHFWPLATNTVAFTDRIKFTPEATGPDTAMHVLYANRSGSPYLVGPPTYPITWFNPDEEADVEENPELDFAILVSYFRKSPVPLEPAPPGGDPDEALGFRALLWNFADEPRQIGVRLWRDLPLGTYEFSIGPDTDGDDLIDGTPNTFEEVVDSTAESITLPYIDDGELTVVECRLKSQGATPCDLDLGIGPDSFKLVRVGQTFYLHVSVHNIGHADYTYAAGDILRLTRSVDGTPDAPVDFALSSLNAVDNDLNPSFFTISTGIAVDVAQDLEFEAELIFASPPCQITTTNDSSSQQF